MRFPSDFEGTGRRVGKVRWWIWILTCLWLSGCQQGLSSAASKYLKDSAAYQEKLSQYQVQLREIPTLAPDPRKARGQEILSQIQQDRTALAAMQPPPSVEKVHAELTELYRILEDFLQLAMTSTGDPGDPQAQKLAAEWSQHLQSLQAELERLEPSSN